MELFRPSKKLIDIIATEDEKYIHYNPLVFYETLIGQDPKKGIDSVFYSGVFNKIQSYYRIDIDETVKSRLAIQKVGMILGEATKNCIEHSPNGKKIFTIGFYFGNNGICFGFNDGGNYFKNNQVKEQYENKIRLNYYHNHGHGINDRIFPYTDLIEVDSKKGILYCVMLKENIIAPEGESGNEYFFEKDGFKSGLKK